MGGKGNHPYQSCHDPECPLPYCRIYKEGKAVGHGSGYDAGKTAGRTEGYSEGYADASSRTA